MVKLVGCLVAALFLAGYVLYVIVKWLYFSDSLYPGEEAETKAQGPVAVGEPPGRKEPALGPEGILAESQHGERLEELSLNPQEAPRESEAEPHEPVSGPTADDGVSIEKLLKDMDRPSV